MPTVNRTTGHRQISSLPPIRKKTKQPCASKLTYLFLAILGAFAYSIWNQSTPAQQITRYDGGLKVNDIALDVISRTPPPPQFAFQFPNHAKNNGALGADLGMREKVSDNDQYLLVMPAKIQCLFQKEGVELDFKEPQRVFERILEGTLPANLLDYAEPASSFKRVHFPPKKSFPINFPSYMIDGITLIENGNMGCELKIKKTSEWAAKVSICQDLINSIMRDLADVARNQKVLENVEKLIGEKLSPEEYVTRYHPELQPKEYIKIFQQSYHFEPEDIYGDAAFRGYGSLGKPVIHDLLKEPKIRLGINPVIHANFVEAIKAAEEDWLQNPCFFEKGESEIAESFLRVHEKLMKGLPGETEEEDAIVANPGYRSWAKAVPKKGSHMGFKPLKELLKEKCESKNQLEVIEHSLSNYYSGELSHKGGNHRLLGEGERWLWEKAVYFPPLPHEVPALMSNFINELKMNVVSNKDPIEIAAWAHTQIANIQPFYDGNGRFARLLMNALLIREGYDPVVIFDHQRYIEAVNREQESPGSFTEYLTSTLLSIREGINLFAYS